MLVQLIVEQDKSCQDPQYSWNGLKNAIVLTIALAQRCPGWLVIYYSD